MGPSQLSASQMLRATSMVLTTNGTGIMRFVSSRAMVLSFFTVKLVKQTIFYSIEIDSESAHNVHTEWS